MRRVPSPEERFWSEAQKGSSCWHLFRKARSMREGSMTYAAIGAELGMGWSTVWHAVNGRNWRHVT